MVFVTVILCLLMQRLLGASFLLSDRGLFSAYQNHLQTLCFKLKWLRTARAPVLHLLLFCVPLLLLLVYIGVFLHSYFGSVAYFIWGLLCLWVCVDAYDTVWSRDEDEAAEVSTGQQAHASVHQQINSRQDSHKTSQAYGRPCSQDGHLARAVTSSDKSSPAAVTTLFNAAFSRIFVLVFYFSLGGPVAVVMYRSVYLFSRGSIQAQDGAGVPKKMRWEPSSVVLAHDLLDLLDWLPSRLLGLTYALVGRFAPSFNLWWQQLRKLSHNQALLSAGWGLAALDQIGRAHV